MEFSDAGLVGEGMAKRVLPFRTAPAPGPSPSTGHPR